MTIEQVTAALAERYRIIRLLHAGRISATYRAQDLKLQRDVVVSVVDTALVPRQDTEHFLRSVQIMSQAQHPNILEVFDAKWAHGFVYCVTPFVENTLKERLGRERRLPLVDALRIAHQVASALTIVHANRVIHREVNPANILLNGSDALLFNFERARTMTTDARMVMKSHPPATVTPYMSPEGAAGDRSEDARSDIYSLGCVLYEMLAGELSFSDAVSQSEDAHNNNPNARIQLQQYAAVPAVLRAIVATATASAPGDRFATAAEFAEALEAVMRREAESDE